MKQNLLYSAFFIILLWQASFSQTLSLDATFGTAGKVTNTSVTSGQTIQLQNDGKIVSCFLGDFSISGNVKLARFNSDGTVDTTFGTNGFVNTIIVNEGGHTNMMKLQPDGKILVTGSFSSNGSSNASYLDFCTARYNTDGSIDTTFGTNGYAITGFEALSYEEAQVIEIQSDGKILVGGHSHKYYQSSPNYSADFAVVRYFPNGSVDTSFGINGKFTHNFGTHTIPASGVYSSDFAIAIKINSAGKIIVGGSTTVGESLEDYSNLGIICLNADGTLDTTFGDNGQTVINFGDKDYLTNIKLTAEDKIIATCEHQYQVDVDNDFVNIGLVRLLANGNPDPDFGSNGIVVTNKNSTTLWDVIYDLTVLPNGKIICAGASWNETGLVANFLLIKFNTDGTIDTTFDDVGYKLVDFENSNAVVSSFLIQPDGKFLCAGVIDYSVGCFARLDTNALSVNQPAAKLFSVYPNPFSESITIENQGKTLAKNRVELYDITGKKIFEYQSDESQSYTIPLQKELAKGNYLLKISNTEAAETLKIIKQ
ncbi:T9SS type A sorting domain-containing protein [Flavobacterium sp. XGLA_31]|uniref:delta-60 repeat domain-containing protein n=1 Tax=Flavobacterium sp. XGLA_31 TaxID=3447666 RepID=UPI003F2CE45E